ncbi:DNA methylase, partial [Thermococci archaeon]
MDRRLIEEFLPVKELSKEAKREKAIRHGHISTLHVWWARRPLVVSRAAVFASLVNAPQSEEEREYLHDFLVRLCKWETRDDERMENSDLKKARERILSANGGKPPKVLDSMAGGGSIPLEALRLGCEAHAIEYNPVAYLILKATLEYPQKYGRRLARDVERWGHWVLDRAKEELEEFYPTDVEEIVSITGSSMIFYSGRTTPVAYIWSRTIRCPSPSCGAEIPLFRQFWLARKPKKKVALFPVVDRENKRVDFEILQGRELEDAIKWGFNPSEGTVKRAKAICPVCGAAISDKYVRQEAKEGRMGHRLVAVVTTAGRGRGRNYRIANEKDLEAFRKAEKRLEEIKKQPSPWAFGLSWIPDEPMNQNDPNLVSGRGYGFKRWGELFNPRQALALVTFGKWVREAYREILKETNDPEYARAVVTYLGFGVDKMAERNNSLSRWDNTRENVQSALSGHHLHMTWDYAETDVIMGTTSSWESIIDYIKNVILETVFAKNGKANFNTATSITMENSSLDAVIVDPPYYDNVPYADLSD